MPCPIHRLDTRGGRDSAAALGSLSNLRNAYRLSSGNEPFESLGARLTIDGGGREGMEGKLAWQRRGEDGGKKVGMGADRAEHFERAKKLQ